jgi:NAD(P)-dependent dehydrogenase (short-subunit alcohol dehydrogenase family)
MLVGDDPESQSRAAWLRTEVITPVLADAGGGKEGLLIPAPLSKELPEATAQARRLAAAQLIIAEATGQREALYYLLGARDLLVEQLTLIFHEGRDESPLTASLGDRRISYDRTNPGAAREKFRSLIAQLSRDDGTASSQLRLRIAPISVSTGSKPANRPAKAPTWTVRTLEDTHGARETKLGIWVGDLVDIDKSDDVDVIVNSEGIYLEMARMHDTGVSAVVRVLGSNRINDNHDMDDAIFRALIQKAGLQRPVKPGTVIMTTSGRLIERGVKAICHVAAVEPDGLEYRTGGAVENWRPGRGYRPVEDLELCTANVLRRVEELACQTRLAIQKPTGRTVLMPLFGTGNGRGNPRQIARRLVFSAHKHVVSHPKTRLSRILFMAYTENTVAMIEDALECLPLVTRDA